MTQKTLKYRMLLKAFRMLRKYRPENICFMGGSSGGNLAIGMQELLKDGSS